MTDQELTHELHRSTNRHLEDLTRAVNRFALTVLVVGCLAIIF